MPHLPSLTFGRNLLFWLALAATWLMMAVEGPFLSAVSARLADPTPNLASYEMAFSLALLVEAPIIMVNPPRPQSGKIPAAISAFSITGIPPGSY